MSKQKVNSPLLVSHLIRFVGFNICISLIPLGASWVVRGLAEIDPPPGVYAPELLFLAVSVSATALGDITDEKYTQGIKWLFDLLKATLLLGVIASAMFWGFYQYDTVIGSDNINVRNNITFFSSLIAILMVVISLITEVIIAYSRGK